MGTKTSPWIFFDDHIFTSGTRQGIILVGAIGQSTHKNAQMLVFILFRNALSTDGWLGIEKTAHGKPKAGDEQLDFLHRPIRHESQISGFLDEYMLIGLRHKTQYRKLSLF